MNKTVKSFRLTLALSVVATVQASAGPIVDVRLSQPSVAFSSLAGTECAATIAANGWPTRGNARQTGAAAFYSLLSTHSSSDADVALRNEVTAQNLDLQSRDYGRIVDPVTPADTNDTAFGVEAWGPILLSYRDRISPDTVSALEMHSRAALAYFGTHPTSVQYTNIHLLTSAEEVLLGDAVGDVESERRGMAGIDGWVSFTSNNGIHEFESPTYFALDLDALSLGALFATEANQRASFARAQDYVWREIAANAFVPDGRIAGAQSRSYDPLRGADTPMAIHMLYAGLTDRVSDPEQIHCYDSYALARDLDGYKIPGDVAELARRYPRVVTQRVAAGSEDTKYTFVTPEYAIGSSNEDYDETDRVAAIDLKDSSKSLPVVRLVGDKTGYYYGPTPQLQIDGERVWNHVKTRPAIVQDRNYLVALTDLDGKQPYDGGPLTLNVLFPAAGTIAVDGEPVDMSSPKTIMLTSNSVVSVHVGNSTAASRIAMSEADGGGKAAIALGSDVRGLAAGVVRAYATEASRTPAGQTGVRSIVLMGVDSGENGKNVANILRNAKVRATVAGYLWTVDVDLDGRSFEIIYDFATHRSVSRKVDGRPVAVDSTLSVDGSPIGI